MTAITEAQFRAAILPFTLRQEGGLSLDPKDPGNWTGGRPGQGLLKGTRYGIAAASHPRLAIEDLTLEQATDIYWREYVVAPGFGRLDPPILMVTFDAGVNCGTVRAAGWLKVAQAQTSIKAQIASVTAQNLAFHKSLKTWARYGRVWGPRILACQKQASLLVAAAPVAFAALHPAPAAHARRAAPKAATQPPAGLCSQLIRVLADALFSPASKETRYDA